MQQQDLPLTKRQIHQLFRSQCIMQDKHIQSALKYSGQKLLHSKHMSDAWKPKPKWLASTAWEFIYLWLHIEGWCRWCWASWSHQHTLPTCDKTHRPWGLGTFCNIWHLPNDNCAQSLMLCCYQRSSGDLGVNVYQNTYISFQSLLCPHHVQSPDEAIQACHQSLSRQGMSLHFIVCLDLYATFLPSTEPARSSVPTVVKSSSNRYGSPLCVNTSHIRKENRVSEG